MSTQEEAHLHAHELGGVTMGRRATWIVGGSIALLVAALLALLASLWPGESRLTSVEGWFTSSQETPIRSVSGDGKWVWVWVDDQSHQLPVGNSWTRVHPPRPGDQVHVQKIDRGTGHPEYSLIDRERSGSLIWAALLALIALAAVAGLKGVRAFLSTLAVAAVVVLFMLPSIASGHSPVLVALVGGGITPLLVVYGTHGVTRASSAALLGTLLSMLLGLGLGSWLVDLLLITGREIDTNVTGTVMGLDIRGLLLAGFVFGSIGVLNDVTIAQSSTVFELRSHGASVGDSFRRAMRVGRDHISSATYTLVFAYVGASLPLILAMLLSHHSGRAIVSTELVSTEIIRSVVGVLTLCACMPLTTLLAGVLSSETSAHAHNPSERSTEK